MSLLAWIVVGIIAGALAKMFVPSGPGGIVGDLIVGVVGAVVGGWVFSLFGYGGTTGVNLYSIAVAVVGAVVFLAVLRAINGTARA